MLDHAKGRQPADSRIAWKQADALALPFEDRSFDAVPASSARCSFPTRFRATGGTPCHEAGGHFFFSVWDRIEENDFADVITQELAAVFPNDRRGFSPARRTATT